eukprot:CAMPEP_0206488050 /NCGR_PEP_ID=MMETSP0324_2-20121206/42109_1 /ASSEMBLY_ACC=CAM_ASM_000836 /TAXON_ID=2866 /ORGANISM="Crypthecodinium cohnii, Strain Seligo" /LENGTH=476 /DNA_ID=CAMNT_0053966855 /DNA_START=51 /DNA_END=1481 /DNA_ORIENTATION=+
MTLEQLLESISAAATGVIDQITWKRLLIFSSGGLLCKLLWDQYGILRYRNRPPTMLGWPVVGYTPTMIKYTLECFLPHLVKPRPPALLTNFLFANAVMVDHWLYAEKLHQKHMDGDFKTEFPPSFQGVLGENSIICLPGGKIHTHHKKLRNKLLSTLAPKPCLAVLPEMSVEVRAILDELVEATAKDGSGAFEPRAAHLAAKVSTLQITAGLEPATQARVEELTSTVMEGIFGVPINLGRFSQYGRALAAKKELRVIIKKLLDSPIKDKRNVLADLASTTEGGVAFSLEETLDTIVTLLLAGKLTTADALPNVVANLCRYPEWVAKIAAEPLEFHSIEAESDTLKFVMECLRCDPPVGAFRRTCKEALDLGEYGVIPPQCQMAVIFRASLQDVSDKFDPSRWTPEQVASLGWLPFGGHQPHSCIGRNLALLELQLFARILCREYTVQADDLEKVVIPGKVFSKLFKDGMQVKVYKK